MFSSLRNTLPRQFSRAYSTASTGGSKNGNGILWASLATGAVLVGGYYYTRSKETASIHTGPPASKALDPTQFKQFKLLESTKVNHDTSHFRFALEPNQELGLDITSCLVVKAKIGDDVKPTIRPYTPVSPENARGYFDLMIKKYPTGKMSSHIHAMSPGDVLEVKGPIAKYPYKKNTLKEVGMIAGGSGLTPMFQLIQHVLDDPEDKTKLTLLFANKTEDDILMRSTLDKWAKDHPDRFQVHYVVDKALSKDWKGEQGHVTKEMIQKYMPASSQNDVLVSVCGPPPMMKLISGTKAPDFSQGQVEGLFKELGYSSQQVFKF